MLPKYLPFSYLSVKNDSRVNKVQALVLTEWSVQRRHRRNRFWGKNEYFMFGHVEIEVPLSYSGRDGLSDLQIYRLEEVWL